MLNQKKLVEASADDVHYDYVAHAIGQNTDLKATVKSF